MRDKLEIKDKINSLYNPNEAWLSSLLTRVLRLVVFLLIGLFLAYIKSHEQASKGIMTICYEIFLSLNTLFSFSKGIVATLYLIKAKYQTILIVLGVAVGLEIFWYPFSNWVINQLVLLFNRTRNLFKRTKSIFDDGARCVLLDGPWGSGKTTYYKNHIKPHFNSESIYISCFSATREQLITQLIIANPIFNLLSLHGVLSGLIKNSWQSFMPRNKIIVFDDLERLHKADDETYRDLIGIMSLLKEQNNCKLLMICCRAEIKAEIFNKYLERICDFEIGDYGKSTKHVDLLNDKDLNRILNKISDKKIIDDCKYYLSRSIDKYYNLRVIRLTLISLIRSINELFKNQIIKGHQYKFDDFRHLIDRLLEYIFQDIKMAVKLNVVYFSQYEVYKVISDDEIFRSIVQRKTSQDKLNDAEKDILKNLQMLKLDPNEILKFKLPERNILENMLGRLNLKDFILNNYLKIKHIEFNKYELFFQLAYINKFFPLSELSMKTFDFNSGIKKQLLIAYEIQMRF
jgi:energy-coupling factor transporter ATP-binding protein EcfA2